MRGVREVQRRPSATVRVAVLRALFEDGVFLRGDVEAPADDDVSAARPLRCEVPAHGEVPAGGDGEVPADGAAPADEEVPADGGMDMLVVVNRCELHRRLLARFSRRFSASIRSLQCDIAFTDEDVGIGALFSFAEAFAYTLARARGQVADILREALAAGMREHQNFLEIVPANSDDEFDHECSG